jgi:hypothetical protein
VTRRIATAPDTSIQFLPNFKDHRDASVRKQIHHEGTKAQSFNELRAFVVNLLAD